MTEEHLIRFITHRSTPEEVKQIEEWISADEKNAEYLFELERLWSVKNETLFSEDRHIEESYNRLLRQLSLKKKTRLFSFWTKGAAAAIIVVLLSLNIYKQWNEEEGMNIIEVPKGELVSLTLSDGTRVWLNADTKFSYPSGFLAKNREVTIDGEGYFEVTPHKKPFIVKGELFNVKVLGTEFNIKAHANEDAEISLKKGQIEVKRSGSDMDQMILKPDEQICYTRDGHTRFSSKDLSTINNWSKGEIAFYSQPLSVIIKALERKYNVSIVLQDKELSDSVFTCRTKSGATLVEVLELLKETHSINYILEPNQVTITKNELPMKK